MEYGKGMPMICQVVKLGTGWNAEDVSSCEIGHWFDIRGDKEKHTCISEVFNSPLEILDVYTGNLIHIRKIKSDILKIRIYILMT